MRSATELALIRRSVQTNSRAFEQTVARLKPGMSERDLAAELAQQFLAVTVLLGEKHESLDDDGDRHDRADEQTDHSRSAPLDEA